MYTIPTPYGSRTGHSEGDVALGGTTIAMSSLGNAEADGQIARPGPQGSGVGERHLQVLSIQGQVGIPHRLSWEERRREVATRTTRS